ncbi:LOW QUALITY PROTEIN: rho GTPase-activating protein 28 [Menidia menidia]
MSSPADARPRPLHRPRPLYRPRPPGAVTSDPRRAAMETYWTEVQSFEEWEEEEEEGQSLDELEQEAAWLKEAGLSSLVPGSWPPEAPPPEAPPPEALPPEAPPPKAPPTEAPPPEAPPPEAPPPEALLSSLSGRQAATVRRRLDSYNRTLRQRNRPPLPHVRDLFPQADGPVEPPPPRGAESPPSRYHTTTKTIRPHRGRPTLPAFVFEDQLPENPDSPPPHPLPPPPSHSSRLGGLKAADWLLRDTPYSEGAAQHKGGGTCWDCRRFRGDENSELQLAPPPPSEGLTWAEDLSPRDLTRLGFISHIELSTLLLALGVQIKRTRPPRCKAQERGVFGVPLSSLLEADRRSRPGTRVPVVFQKLLSVVEQTGLQTEGILRVPGSAARMKALRRALDLDGGSGPFDWSSVRPAEASGLLKLFIRELPDPLLTHGLLPTFLCLLGVPSEVHQVQALQLLALLLPEAHRSTLRALLVFLRKVVSHQEQNRMSLWNVSMVMAPNLFAARNRRNSRSVAKQREEMAEAVGGAHLVQLMVRHQDLLWTVPSFLLSQVRQINQASNQRAVLSRTRLLGRKSTRNHTNQVPDLCDGVIRVLAPRHSKVSTAIQLDERITARDVTARFGGDTSPAQHLYEVGGNIGERRLHPDCPLLPVHRANPRCDWLVRP